jgi:Tol biopolymer transport system component
MAPRIIPALPALIKAKWLILVAVCVLLGVGLIAHGADPSTIAPSPFSNPQRVTINGYTQDAEEPFISRDGNYLFFDNSNDPKRTPNTDIFYATRIDDVTFQYQGPITGVDTTTALEGVPSMDVNNVFYFVSPRSYPQTFSTIYSGPFSNGNVSQVALVAGVSRDKAGWVNFDAEISADGNTLYFVDSYFGKGGNPKNAKIVIAHKGTNGFVRDKNSAKIMRRINVGGLNYAADTSASELEIFFTRLMGANASIYMASRSDRSQPFGAAVKIKAATGFVEGPSISPDGKSLYYHHAEPDGSFAIYRVTRP